MKIGVSLVGISHLDSEKTNKRDSVGRLGRNRRNDAFPPNIVQNIIEPLQGGNDVSVYLTTYDHKEIADLTNLYSPKKIQILTYDDHFMQTTYTKSLTNLLDQDLDFVISTRFDIVYRKAISDFTLDYEKMNALFKEKDHNHLNYTCDNFYAFPAKYLEKFSQAILSMYDGGERNGMHGAIHEMSKYIGYDNINFIDSVDQLGHNNNYYYLPH